VKEKRDGPEGCLCCDDLKEMIIAWEQMAPSKYYRPCYPDKLGPIHRCNNLNNDCAVMSTEIGEIFALSDSSPWVPTESIWVARAHTRVIICNECKRADTTLIEHTTMPEIFRCLDRLKCVFRIRETGDKHGKEEIDRK